MKPLLSMQAGRRRWARLGSLGVAALVVHLLAFSGLDWAWPRHESSVGAAAAVQVRVIDAPVVTAPPVVDEPRASPPSPPPVKVAALPPRAARRAPPVITPAVAEIPEVAAVQVASATPTLVAVAAMPAPEAPPGIELIPHYRTQMPPALTLRYVMQRGGLRGNGDLSWRPDGDHYELKLEGRVAGLSVLTQISQGAFDAAGVAPLRFTDQRLRRGTKAANFQRAAGKITFSGPSTEFPLRDGTQDRLSWMVQLGAIVAAEPKLRGVGAKVVMNVVGANGDASVWAFDCTAIESVTTGAGSVNALKFVREPREPYDTQVQVWIDPAQHYLPVRAMQRSGTGDEVFELRLQSVETAS
ncbi:MAG: DUF3108 domain-containing protein [Burkholderiales bacterium]